MGNKFFAGSAFTAYYNRASLIDVFCICSYNFCIARLVPINPIKPYSFLSSFLSSSISSSFSNNEDISVITSIAHIASPLSSFKTTAFFSR